MAEAALQVHRELSSEIVRRLVARPIRIDARGSAVIPAETVVTQPEPAAAAVEAPREEVEPAVSGELARLRTEMTLMKAVLEAERRETARLRACIEDVATPGPVLDDARATRDRWATLVDRLLHAPR
ncbi:hypothetical protein [Methylobacterium iners]|uniref:Uncharacterized protein n=1 Tax=Methylobacterium iners TaxID=418707 RepID=A0ABQ4S023_9HYPH|nr:hypothetical protein [Methylobacterium iners]GJD96458.1 hypothetical protein OCOJLMKI_3679 [Methylobacterium iners]